jgi:hypothetical protein
MMTAWLLGSIIPTIVILSLVTYWRAWPDFVFSFKFLMVYSVTGVDSYYCSGFTQVLHRLFITGLIQFKAYWMPVLGITIVSLPFFIKKEFFRKTHERPDGRKPCLALRGFSMTREGVWFALSVAMALGALVSICTPHRAVPHYLFFMIMPVLLLAAVCFFGGVDSLFEKMRGGKVVGILLYCGVAIIPQVAVRSTLSSPFIPYSTDRSRLSVGPVAAFINKHAKPGDSLALWGWYAELAVETQLPLATRIPTLDSIRYPADQKFAIERYVSDMALRRPRFFVDTTGQHENVPSLRHIIITNYLLLAHGGNVRIYVLK